MFRDVIITLKKQRTTRACSKTVVVLFYVVLY